MPAVSLTRKRLILKDLLRSISQAVFSFAWPLIPRSVYLGDHPLRLVLAITRKCNANCVFCAYQFARDVDKIHMHADIFARVIDEIEHAGVKYVMLSPNIGEPLLAPDFINKVKQLRTAGTNSIEVTTNAVLLHRIGLETMLTEGPDVINISFAGFDKEMYERDYRIRNYERTRDNIVGLLRLNKSFGKHRKINLRLRGDKPVAELLAAPEMSEVRLLVDDIETMTEVDDWLGLIKREALPDGYVLQTEKPPLSQRPCNMLFDLTVHPDGDIHLCSCRNVYGDPELHIGNIKDMSLRNAHDKIRVILSLWEKGCVPKTCKTCSMYWDPAQGLLGRWRENRRMNR